MKILITSDFCPNNRIVNLIEDKNINGIFNDFKDIIVRNDYRITNLECPIKPNEYTKIAKTGPSLSTTTNALGVLKEVGFNILTLANNHIKDFGEEGIAYTIESIENEGLQHVGAGKGKNKASETLFFEKNKKVALINVAENEFSTTFDQSYGAHGLDIINVTNKIKDAKNNADYVILIYHGGHEMYKYPSPRMKKLFRFFVDNGCDAVFCHHSHCYSGYEVYQNSPIFYGLGNFIFDLKGSRDGIWNTGYAVELKIEKSIEFNIVPYVQGGEVAGVRLMNEKEKIDFDHKINKLNTIISDDSLLEKKFIDFVKKNERGNELNLQPYNYRLFRGLFRRGLLPNIVSKSKKRVLLNLVRCESHRDVLTEYLKGIQK